MKDNFYLIGILQIPQNMIMERPLWYFDHNNREGMRSIYNELKSLTNYRFDNNKKLWSNIFGDFFSISIHFVNNQRTNKKYWEIYVWDAKGNTSIINFTQDSINKEEDVLSDQNYNILTKYTEDFSRGKVRCSDCKKEINHSEIAGRYFAGVYCNECWERKWKVIEAKETYN